MCNHIHYEHLKETVDKHGEQIEDHDNRLDALEKTDAVHETKFQALADSVKYMRNVMYTFAFIMLLAIIYGALGPHGFNAVTKASATPSAVR